MDNAIHFCLNRIIIIRLNAMLNENRMMGSNEERGLSPQERIKTIQWEADQIAEDYINKDPKELKSDDYYAALNKMETLRRMAEGTGNEKLLEYLGIKTNEIEEHKTSGSKLKLESMSAFKKVRDSRKPQIGTHN